ncbi:Imm26 family immunity protein [Xanthomonas translucens]|uniref:Imm26 family immunity protein n=1 Tax=Xanthomonas campestris pv. translucens TaxID=343 RepID=UPI0009C0CBA3|nr:Imm26 family immunity protein [Xanthomonas translucens]QEO27253.1 phosphotriesterase [Xanthomonas translucens pv. undulosa]WLA07626.1 Imm26 family immunity protein [Xanthomonas translucens]
MIGEIFKYGWDKKKRTMLRFIKPGDFFCFALPSGKFGAGRIIAKVSVGHSAEIYDSALDEPVFTEAWNGFAVYFYDVLDSYSLFDRKIEGDWRIVGNSNIKSRKIHEETFFGYGSSGSRTKVNLIGQRFECSEEEYKHLPPYRPAGNEDILEKIKY